MLERRGVFFVGGRHVARHGGGTVTTGQMAVAYDVPARRRAGGLPIVLVPGGCHTGAVYDETPDGREGWRHHFLRQGYPVYVTEWAGRGASGFDPGLIGRAIDEGDASLLPRPLYLSHEEVWSWFRFGPAPGRPFDDARFPFAALDHYLAQLIPNTEAFLPDGEESTVNGLAALLARIGPAVVIGHSRASNVTLPLATRHPERVAALVELEPISCRPLYRDDDVPVLARVPLLALYGDHLEGSIWPPFAAEWRELVERVVVAGGTAEYLELAEAGIRGNSHMLMTEDNHLEIADLLIRWIDRHARTGPA